jgi:hypothetical protein
MNRVIQESFIVAVFDSSEVVYPLPEGSELLFASVAESLLVKVSLKPVQLLFLKISKSFITQVVYIYF